MGTAITISESYRRFLYTKLVETIDVMK